MKWNESAIRQLATSSQARAAIEQSTEAVAAIARAGAPVLTGEYRDEIRTEYTQTENRVLGRVVFGSEHSAIVEAQTGNAARALNEAAGRG